MAYSTGIWEGLAKKKVLDGSVSLSDMIGTRDDLFLYLRKLGVDRKKAYMIMNRVRKGRHLTIEEEAKLRELGAEEWVLDICSNVKYMFPRAHIAQLIRRDAFCIDEPEYELNDNLGLDSVYHMIQ